MTQNVDWHGSRQQTNWIATICYILSHSRIVFWRHHTGIFIHTSQTVSHLSKWWSCDSVWAVLVKQAFCFFVNFSSAPSENVIHHPVHSDGCYVLQGAHFVLGHGRTEPRWQQFSRISCSMLLPHDGSTTSTTASSTWWTCCHNYKRWNNSLLFSLL